MNKQRLAKRATLGILGLAALFLLIDGAVTVFQPALEEGDGECVLHTFDADGTRHQDRMIVVIDGETLWVQSGHHFRGWYWRLVDNPRVELEWRGARTAYHAVPLETPDAKAHMRDLLIQRVGLAGYYTIRTFLLFADVKPVRLDPLPAS